MADYRTSPPPELHEPIPHNTLLKDVDIDFFLETYKNFIFKTFKLIISREESSLT